MIGFVGIHVFHGEYIQLLVSEHCILQWCVVSVELSSKEEISEVVIREEIVAIEFVGDVLSHGDDLSVLQVSHVIEDQDGVIVVGSIAETGGSAHQVEIDKVGGRVVGYSLASDWLPGVGLDGGEPLQGAIVGDPEKPTWRVGVGGRSAAATDDVVLSIDHGVGVGCGNVVEGGVPLDLAADPQGLHDASHAVEGSLQIKLVRILCVGVEMSRHVGWGSGGCAWLQVVHWPCNVELISIFKF